MPELDFTPADTPERLESLCNYTKGKVYKYESLGEKDKASYYSDMLRTFQYEHIASLHIRNAWLDVKRRKASL